MQSIDLGIPCCLPVGEAARRPNLELISVSEANMHSIRPLISFRPGEIIYLSDPHAWGIPDWAGTMQDWETMMPPDPQTAQKLNWMKAPHELWVRIREIFGHEEWNEWPEYCRNLLENLHNRPFLVAADECVDED